MIFRIEKIGRWLHRHTSRNHWLVKILGLGDLPPGSKSERRQGLIMIQIDGLSHGELQHALTARSMPFLKNLLECEQYHLHSMYSGIPTSTPSAQGELFYGINACTPAFSFKRHQDGKVVIMLEPEAAAYAELELKQTGGQPLLAGGSAYSNIFSGGAKESSFCAASMGWSSVMPSNNLFKMAIYAILNIYSFLRVAVLMVFEFVLAVVDFFRGLIDGKNLYQELKYVPTRVAACVLLRELVTIGVKLDAARGLPIIHANFVGYDEQSHRRGPRSRFAHWSLRGIDNAIARIWRTAQHSEYRNYDVWIYSDHGQEATIPAGKAFPAGITWSVINIFRKHELQRPTRPEKTMAAEVKSKATSDLFQKKSNKAGTVRAAESSLWSSRANWLGLPGFGKWVATGTNDLFESQSGGMPEVVAMGPLGFIYLPYKFSSAELSSFARALVNDTAIPLVLSVNHDPLDDNSVLAWTRDGDFKLPADRRELLGVNHPFLEQASADLIRLVHHADAGDLVFSGWRPGKTAMSFRTENGAHAGPGINETHAFALLPGDTRFDESGINALRIVNLRQAALRLLGRDETRATSGWSSSGLQSQAVLAPAARSLTIMPKSKAPEKRHCLRVLTYNIHSCVGMDGKLSVARIARVISQYQPDVVALQELNINTRTTPGADQARLIAQELGMTIHLHPVINVKSGKFGNAILTDLPMRCIRAEKLAGTSAAAKKRRSKTLHQPRGALWVEVEFNGKPVNIITTHLGLTPAERRVQVDELLSDKWINHPHCVGPVVLCGDFNAAPSQQAYRRLITEMKDVQMQLEGHKPKKTFSGRLPTMRLDHVFINQNIRVDAVSVPTDSLAKVASDHLPLVVDLILPGDE